MTTRKKLLPSFVESCADCPHVQVTVSKSDTEMAFGVICVRGLLDECVESANLMSIRTIKEPSGEAIRRINKELREHLNTIPEWCPLEDWHPPD